MVPHISRNATPVDKLARVPHRPTGHTWQGAKRVACRRVPVPLNSSQLDDGRELSRPPPRGRLLGLVGQLSSVNLVIAFLGLLTGPLLARALGPSGRGDLAAILVPLGLMSQVAGLGLGTFAIREAALGRRTSHLVGSLGPIVLAIGLVSVVSGPFLAGLIAGGRETVYLFLVVGFCTVPLGLFSDLLASIAVGSERWRTYIAVRFIPPLVMVAGIVVLFVVDRLTVASAAVVSLVAGLASVLPLLPLLRDGRPRFLGGLAREGLRFGGKAWIGGLGLAANVRLDQLLMTRLVAPRELGLYVVAVTSAGFLLIPMLGALGVGGLARFTYGERGLIAQVLRVSLLGAILVGVILAMTLPALIPLVFGGDFRDAVVVSWVLLAANVPLAGANVLGTALTSCGRPGLASASQILALAITIPGLIVLLPILGAFGAALVSLLAYSASFSMLLILSRRELGGGFMEFLMVRRSDVARVTQPMRSRVRRPRR